MKLQTLQQYLRRYSEYQDQILLVYHPERDSRWNDRCFYLDEKYSPRTPYNHRSIINNEVVIEFDSDEYENNKAWADRVSSRLRKDGIPYAKWGSGNRSVHVHFFIEVGKATNLKLLKRLAMKHYCEGLPQPDLALAGDNHLIRAEYGIHEKTGRAKKLISKEPDYPKPVRLPADIWEKYQNIMSSLSKRTMTQSVNNTHVESHPGFKYMVDPEQFRASDDGRERALYMIIQVIKPKFETKHQLTKFLQEWYRYCGGRQMSPEDIKAKVNYHWNRYYPITKSNINELMISIGRKDLVQ